MNLPGMVGLIVASSALSIFILRWADARLPPDPGPERPSRANLLQQAALRGGIGVLILGVMSLLALLVDPGRLFSGKGLAFLLSIGIYGALPGLHYVLGESLWRWGESSPLRRRAAVGAGFLLGILVSVAVTFLAVLHFGYVVRSVGSVGHGLEALAEKAISLLSESTQDLLVLSACVGVPGGLVVGGLAWVRDVALRWCLTAAGVALSWPIAWAAGVPDAWVLAAVVFALAGLSQFCVDVAAPLDRRLWPAPPPEEPCHEG